MNEQIWFFGIIVLSLLLYVVLDGYDLGMGISAVFQRDRTRGLESLEIVGTVWDGNESWIVLLGVSLWAGFPQAYGTILPHVYLPLIVMLFALIIRGASIEFVSQGGRGGNGGIRAFAISSLVAAFCQGVIFGALTEAVPLTTDHAYAGGAMDFLTPYTVLTGLTTVLLYASLGCAYLRIKMEGAARTQAGRWGRLFLVFGGLGAGVATLSLGATAAPLDMTGGRGITIWILTVLILVAVISAFIGLGHPREHGWHLNLPFLGITAALVLSFLAFAVGRYPVLLPENITLASSASPTHTFEFLLVGIGLNIPLLLFYNWYSHRVFRGPFHPSAPTPAAAQTDMRNDGAVTVEQGGERR